jgi:hypothetical protein
MRQQGPVAVSQALVQWSGQPEALATWEDLDDLRRRFPRAPAWGQAGSQGRGSVSDDTATQDPQADVARAKRDRRESRRYAGNDWVKK